MKKLGLGMMRLPLLDPDDATSVDLDQVCRMVDAFLENGFTYFDTAYMYHNYQSEIIVRRTLVERHPRESFCLASKLPTMRLEKEGDQERIFEEQLSKCGVEYFDYYLLHTLNTRLFEIAERFDSFGFVSKMKKAGKVKHFGFSFHDTAEVLDRILTAHPEVDFVQIQLNYLDWESDRIQSRKCHEVCVRHGKQIIVMEPVKGGTLAKLPHRGEALLREAAPQMSIPSWAIRFAAGCENVFMVLSGMSNMAQLQDNMSYMKDFRPLSPSEEALLPQVVRMIREDIGVDCTACRYCVEGCPKAIEIPKYFALYNAAKHEAGKREEAARQYRELILSNGKASACIRCHKCENACPQQIRIPDALELVAKEFE